MYNNPETNQYFYHPDHLGSSSFISDAIGYATQHLQYLPYGETFVDQHGAFDSRYKFSAKELDDETQYSYFGARYYDSDLSVWLSVDPLSDEYPHQSPFMYCSGNPVMRVDMTGMNDGWVEGNGTGVYWDPNINNEAQAREKGLIYHGQTVIVKGETTNRLRYGDSHGQWHDASTLRGVTIYGFKGGGAFCRGMENSKNKGYDPNWIYSFYQFVDIGLTAYELTLTAAMLSEAVFRLKPGYRPVPGVVKNAENAVNAAKGVVKYSDDLVMSAQKLYPNKAGKIELHHPIPQYLGGAKNQTLVPLDAAHHQQITNAFRAEWRYGIGKPSAAQLDAIMKKVYSQFALPK